MNASVRDMVVRMNAGGRAIDSRRNVPLFSHIRLEIIFHRIR